MISTLLLILAGFLTGGVIALVRARATKFSIGLVGVLAALAFAGSVAWMGES